MAKIKKRLVEGSKSVYIIDYPAYRNKTAGSWKANKKTIAREVKTSETRKTRDNKR